MPDAPKKSADWPGKRIGLPERGPRSVGRLGRRLAALAIDWGASVVITIAFVPYDRSGEFGILNYPAFAVYGIFAVTQIVFLLVANGSPGHLALGMRVVPVVPGYLGVWRPFTRTILLCLVVPALIWDKDQRGMHDRLSGTVLVRR